LRSTREASQPLPSLTRPFSLRPAPDSATVLGPTPEPGLTLLLSFTPVLDLAPVDGIRPALGRSTQLCLTQLCLTQLCLSWADAFFL